MNQNSLCGVVAVFLGSVFLTMGSAQTISDSNQNQTWGVWKTPNPTMPGLQFHAKCDKDIDLDGGKIASWWSYQFRSTYKGTMDFIYLVEGGIADPKVNKMLGGFKDTLKPGEIHDGGNQLWGSCSQHSLPKTGLHMTLKCVVPTGQDAACFKDADGNPYPQATQSGSEPGQTTPIEVIPIRSVFCVSGIYDHRYYISHPFMSSQPFSVLEAAFKEWVAREHPQFEHAEGCFKGTESDVQSVIKMSKSPPDSSEATEVSWSPK